MIYYNIVPPIFDPARPGLSQGGQGLSDLGDHSLGRSVEYPNEHPHLDIVDTVNRDGAHANEGNTG